MFQVVLVDQIFLLPIVLTAYVPPYGEKLNPKPFKYKYGVQGHGPDFSKTEIQVRSTRVRWDMVMGR